MIGNIHATSLVPACVSCCKGTRRCRVPGGGTRFAGHGQYSSGKDDCSLQVTTRDYVRCNCGAWPCRHQAVSIALLAHRALGRQPWLTL